MSDSELSIRLDDDRRVYHSGETLSGEFQVNLLSLTEPQAVELSVLWYTEGQGDEDLAVHYFERFSKDDRLRDLHQPQRFSTTLPNCPLSYDGVLLRIFWCVRLRMFLSRGKEIMAEELFRLGDVPSAVLPAGEEPAS